MKRNNLIKVLKKIYKLLDTKQKLRFILIIIIMIVSATLAQMTPKAIGWLTDDILTKNEISFNKVIPFLVFILIVNVANEVIKIFRRVLVEDTATTLNDIKNRFGQVIECFNTAVVFNRDDFKSLIRAGIRKFIRCAE